MHIFITVFLLLFIGCADSPDSTSDVETNAIPDTSDIANEDPAEDTAVVDVPPVDTAEYYEVELGPFTVPAGEERFLCFTTNVPEDMWVDFFDYEATPVVHHLILSEALAPEPEGMTECDTLFRVTWSPLFLAGAGDSQLAVPEGTGHQLEEGVQLVGQLHLLNVSDEEVTDSAVIRLRKTEEEGLEKVKLVAFGTFNVALPPLSDGEAIGQCAIPHDMYLFGAFPHMHYLGQTLVVEAGPSPDTMEEVFRSDPYDFDNQAVLPMDLNIAAGDEIRVSCTYFNPHEEMVTFGESTLNEMCFFVGFATGEFEGIGGCMGDGGSGDGGGGFLPAGCGEGEPNDLGIGASCTAGGGECAEGLDCTADLLDGPGMCIKIGPCESAAECGNDAICCTPVQAGGVIDICVPDDCEIPGCTPK